uniref:Uncharacterized protein n=2 Tax=Thermoplasma acidophilum TaxID=2303 RepID=Q0KKZ3_THEAI|nr:hypothetical protein [Cloning vector pSTA]BAF30817.1 hypothetical protein [Thermoplasma acidophilum]
MRSGPCGVLPRIFRISMRAWLIKFSSIFSFSSIHDGDLRRFAMINDFLAWAVANLKPYQFIDVRNAYSERLDVPIFTLDYAGFSAYMDAVVGMNWDVRYEDEVMAVLKNGPASVSDIVDRITSKYPVSRKEASDKVWLVLGRFRDNDMGWADCQGHVLKLRHIDMDLKHDEGGLWFLSGSNMSVLHDWMEGQVVRVLRDYHVEFAVPPEYTRRRDADIVLHGFKIEIETGLKKDSSALVDRISSYDGPVVVVVPNQAVKSRYARILSGFQNVNVLTLLEFIYDLKREYIKSVFK